MVGLFDDKMMSADKAAEQIVRAVERNKKRLLITKEAKQGPPQAVDACSGCTHFRECDGKGIKAWSLQFMGALEAGRGLIRPKSAMGYCLD